MIQRLLMFVVLAVTVTAAVPASAQEAPAKPYATPHAPQPGGANSEEPWRPQTRPSEEQMQREMKEQQENRTGRSGFWTSPYPAKNGAYRYRLLLLGCAIVLIMGLVMMRLIKRARPPQPRP